MCDYCVKFVDPSYAKQFFIMKTAANKPDIVVSHNKTTSISGNNTNTTTTDSNFTTNTMREDDFDSEKKLFTIGGTDKAIIYMIDEMDKSKSIAQFEEIKLITEISLGLI